MLRADEWLYGRAGYLHGLLAFQAQGVQDSQLEASIKEIAKLILQRGAAYARQLNRWAHPSLPPPLMWEWYGDRYMGAAHGVMGILFMLLHVKEMCEGDSLLLIQQSLQWLADMRQPSGNWPVV